MSDDNICRSCLSSDKNLQRLDSTISNDLTIAECLRICLNAQVFKDDGLPFTVCLNCLTELLEVHKFHVRYFESEAHLTASLNWKNHRNFEAVHEAAGEIGVKFEVKEENESEPDIGVEMISDDEALTEYVDDTKYIDSSKREFSFMETNSNDLEEHSDSPDNSDEGTLRNDLACRKLIAKIFCLQCDQEFPTRNDLREHFHSVHGEDNARGLCIRCQKTFSKRGRLMAHLVWHQGLKTDFQCEVCGRICLNQHRLDLHALTHTGERPHVCRICSKAFSQKSILNTHMTLHTGKTVPCPKCDKKFSRPSFLKIHMRIHDDVRPYACHLCPKKYRNSSHLKEHLTTHSNVRNFVCDICAHAFKDRNSLRVHHSIHTRPYKCPVCHLRVAKLYPFRIHLQKMHNIYDDPKNYMVSDERSYNFESKNENQIETETYSSK